MANMDRDEYDRTMKRLQWVAKVVIAAEHIDEDHATKVAAKKKFVNDELKKVFSHLDRNGDGVITMKEFDILVRGPTGTDSGGSSAKAKQAYNSLDSDGSGDVDEGEFLNYFGKHFHGGFYTMSRVEVAQYIEFMQAVATMQTGFTPEEAGESYSQEFQAHNASRGCKPSSCSIM